MSYHRGHNGAYAYSHSEQATLPPFRHSEHYVANDPKYMSKLFTKPYNQWKPASGPISQILQVQDNLLDQMIEVQQFRGLKEDREYLYLDDIISKNIELLDKIDGNLTIRNVRKEAIKSIQKCLTVLEDKAEYNKLKLLSQQPQTPQYEEREDRDVYSNTEQHKEHEQQHELEENNHERKSDPMDSSSPTSDIDKMDTEDTPTAEVVRATEVRRPSTRSMTRDANRSSATTQL